MMIKLTNMSQGYRNSKLLINPRHILSVFESEVDDEKVTTIYTVTQQSWNVKESFDAIYKMIKASND
jgi:hypothetical protein